MRLILLFLLLARTAFAQLPNQEYRGVTETGLLERKLGGQPSVLVIGAHPDDEDSQLLAYLSLARGAHVSYLSLTRGEGGQNSIGNELGPALGILRTGELLAARSVDRSDQYFTRAYDFGFSKNAEETFQHWPRDSILFDVVAVVRRVRPDVIVAIFSGTPRDGHGHHQVSGILAREAFVAAADPTRFPEQIRAGLMPHKAQKLVQATGYRQAEPTEIFQTGVVDPLFGRSFAQIGAVSRSRHRSQDMGQAEPLGPRSTSIRVIEAEGSGAADSLIFAGLRPTVIPDREQRLRQDAEVQAAGVVIDAVVDRELLIPGSTIGLQVQVWNAGNRDVHVFKVLPNLPARWVVETGDTSGAAIDADTIRTWNFRIRLPEDAQISQPYFLRQPRTGDTYSWPALDPVAGLPFEPAPITATVDMSIGTVRLQRAVTPTFRLVDRRQGETRRIIHVVPAYAIRPEPATAVITMAALASGRRSLEVSAEILSNGDSGTLVVRPELPPGWRAMPQQMNVRLSGPGDVAHVKFGIEPARAVRAGQYELRFAATDGKGRTYGLTQRTVDYPHVENRVLFEPAAQNITVLDARFARGIRVGYIVGMDPQVPPVLEQLGVLVERLGAAQLASADLGIYDAVVIGSRAYEMRPDLVANNARVLDYARRGGNVISLYQQYEFIESKFAPYKLSLARPHTRITDESSPVIVLDTAARAMRAPNRITQRDFMGWVQERALYMPNTWAPEYKPLLEMSDPGEASQRGAILVAPLGKGLYTYTGLAFFRQIPAGVPGALRLFINLLSMGIKDVTF